jgi:hypothetical protein
MTASPAPSVPSARPPCDPRLQPYLQNQATWGFFLQTLRANEVIE